MNPTPPVPTLPQASDQYAQLKSAVLGAQQAGGASPLGNFPELQRLATNTAAVDANVDSVRPSTYNTQVQEANRKAAEAEARSKANAMLDPSKYSRVPADDGGWNFIAPNGQKISANDYSRITGQSLDKVLANSQNPIDIGFTNDFKNLQAFMDAVQNGDKTKVDATIKAQPELGKYQNDLRGLIQRFQDHYPTVFGGNRSGNQPINSTYIPNQGVATNADLSTIGG